MPFDLERVAPRLASQSSQLEDAGDLPPTDAARVRSTLEQLAASGRRAHVVALPRGAPLAAWHSLFGRAGLDDRRDLLLLWNGQRMEARGWGLPPGRIHDALLAVEDRIGSRPGEAIALGLAGLARAADQVGAPAAPSAPAPPTSGVPAAWTLGGGALLALGLLGGLALVVRRRNQRAADEERAAS